jgi:cytochrome c biogenesis protein CcdA
MSDPVISALRLLEASPAAAFGSLFTAGLLTSVGPCVAPRYVAVASLTQGRRNPSVAIAAFVGGLTFAYVVLGFAAGALGTLRSASTTIDVLLAGALVGGGCIALVRARPLDANHHRCEPRGTRERHSLGAAFLLGASSALVVSPCCTPVVGAVAATTTALGNPLMGAALLAAFALGHALPLIGVGQLRALVERGVPPAAAQAPAIVSAVLMIALGLYYGMLA